MKKVNIVFIGECVIILLLLLVLGILLKNNNQSALGKESVLAEESVLTEESTLAEERINEEAVGDSQRLMESPANTTVSSGVVNVSEFINTSSESVSGNAASSVSANKVAEGKILEGKKIVVFGDSIWNAARGKDGISEYIQEETGATIYNCAVGGSTAALVEGENSMENWTSSCFNGMIYVARKLVPAEPVLGGLEAYDVIKEVDFNEMDYVIVAYGLNDYFCDVSIFPKEYNELTNYVGALRNGIGNLKLYYPHLKIIVVSPTYTKMFEGERQFGIGAYVEAARDVAEEMDVYFLDMFHALGSDAESRSEHLGDGVHMSAEGRKTYADAVVWYFEGLKSQDQ